MATYSLPERNNVVQESEFNTSVTDALNAAVQEAVGQSPTRRTFRGAYPTTYDGDDYVGGQILRGWVYAHENSLWQATRNLAVLDINDVRDNRPDLTPSRWNKLLAADIGDGPTSNFRGAFPTTWRSADYKLNRILRGWVYTFGSNIYRATRDIPVNDQSQLDAARPDVATSSWTSIFAGITDAQRTRIGELTDGYLLNLINGNLMGLVHGNYPVRYTAPFTIQQGDIWRTLRGGSYRATRSFAVNTAQEFILNHPLHNRLYWEQLQPPIYPLVRYDNLAVEPDADTPTALAGTYRKTGDTRFALDFALADAVNLLTNYQGYTTQMLRGIPNLDGTRNWEPVGGRLNVIRRIRHQISGAADPFRVEFETFTRVPAGLDANTYVDGTVFGFATIAAERVLREQDLQVSLQRDTFGNRQTLGSDWTFMSTLGSAQILFSFPDEDERNLAQDLLGAGNRALQVVGDDRAPIVPVRRSVKVGTTQLRVDLAYGYAFASTPDRNTRFYLFNWTQQTIKRVALGEGLRGDYDSRSQTLTINLASA